jgi:hypothetical protein
MKMFKKLLFAGLAFTALNVSAQTVDEIVTNNIEAMGGASKLATLTSVKKTGSTSVQGMDISLTFNIVQLKGIRIDIEVNGTSNYQLGNNEKGFVFMPVMGMQEPKEMDEDQLKSFSSFYEIQGALFNYKEKGTTIELLGTEKVEGAQAYKLKLVSKNGNVITSFVDAKTYRVVKTVGKVKTPDGQEMDSETTYSDYKQNADGYWFAYSTTSMQGTVTFDKIETNIIVDENIFKN